MRMIHVVSVINCLIMRRWWNYLLQHYMRVGGTMFQITINVFFNTYTASKKF